MADLPLTIGDVLDLIAEPVETDDLGHMERGPARMWRLKDHIDLNARVEIVGTLSGQSNLAVDIAEDDGSLGILEV